MQVACFRCNKAEFDIPNPMFFVTLTSCQGKRWMLRLSSVAEAISKEILFHIVAFFLSENGFRTRLRFFRPENLSKGCELPQWQIWRRRPPLRIWIGKRSSRGFLSEQEKPVPCGFLCVWICCFLVSSGCSISSYVETRFSLSTEIACQRSRKERSPLGSTADVTFKQTHGAIVLYALESRPRARLTHGAHLYLRPWEVWGWSKEGREKSWAGLLS